MNYLKSIDDIMNEKLKNPKNNLFDTEALIQASHISIYSTSTNTESKHGKSATGSSKGAKGSSKMKSSQSGMKQSKNESDSGSVSGSGVSKT